LSKKILIVFAIIGVIAVIGFVVLGALGYGTYKIADEALKLHEPQFRQYLQMDKAAQDKYILDNMTELFLDTDLDKDGKPEDKEKLERLMKLNEQPDIQKAFIDVGRSTLAGFILLSEPVVNEMSLEVETEYQKEYDELGLRLDKYLKLVGAADPSLVEDE